MKTPAKSALALFVLMAALTGCGTAPSSAPAPADGGAVVVHMDNMKFDREQLEVSAGTTVRWVNADQTAHSVYEGVPNSGQYQFKSANLSPGKSFDYRFDKPGTYQIFCNTGAHYMMGMKMSVVVK